MFTDNDAAKLRSNNKQFPFNFQNSPRSISATLSLPLFDGFAREQRVQEAQAASDDARFNVRARELALTADVTAAYLTSDDRRENRRASGAELSEGQAGAQVHAGPLSYQVP